VYSIFALHEAGETAAAQKGLEWLRARQLPDGGWPAQTGLDESSWVTALAALLPPDLLGKESHSRAIQWLMGVVGEESTFVFRFRRWLLGQDSRRSEPTGWPWVRGTATWVVPTSLAILALDKEQLRHPTQAMGFRIAEGRRFLMERMCINGGWNHGSVRVYGVEGVPYPETTGVALAAIRGVRSPAVDRAVSVASAFLKDCRSADAFNWLRVGLMAHGRLPAEYEPTSQLPYRTLIETSVDMLVAETRKGREIFWS
jgi:hypothetical protein